MAKLNCAMSFHTFATKNMEKNLHFFSTNLCYLVFSGLYWSSSRKSTTGSVSCLRSRTMPPTCTQSVRTSEGLANTCCSWSGTTTGELLTLLYTEVALLHLYIMGSFHCKFGNNFLSDTHYILLVRSLYSTFLLGRAALSEPLFFFCKVWT